MTLLMIYHVKREQKMTKSLLRGWKGRRRSNLENNGCHLKIVSESFHNLKDYYIWNVILYHVLYGILKHI